MPPIDTRHDWGAEEVLALFGAPFNDLLFKAQALHRRHFDANRVQLSTLLSIKTGACPEDCAYCPQSARYHTGVKAEPLMDLGAVTAAARAAPVAALRCQQAQEGAHEVVNHPHRHKLTELISI